MSIIEDPASNSSGEHYAETDQGETTTEAEIRSSEPSSQSSATITETESIHNKSGVIATASVSTPSSSTRLIASGASIADPDQDSAGSSRI